MTPQRHVFGKISGQTHIYRVSIKCWFIQFLGLTFVLCPFNFIQIRFNSVDKQVQAKENHTFLYLKNITFRSSETKVV